MKNLSLEDVCLLASSKNNNLEKRTQAKEELVARLTTNRNDRQLMMSALSTSKKAIQKVKTSKKTKYVFCAR